MKGTELNFNQLSKYYDLLYSSKDYKKDAQNIKSLIEKFKKSDGYDLLDVACGTGNHLCFFKDYFHCMGVDMSDKMLEIARRKIPDVELKKANMIDMKLGKKFDILTCLFSAIGYVKTYDNLKKTWETFALHLKKGGVAIVEPWFLVPMSKQIKLSPPPDENIQIAKLILSRLEDNLAILDFHYLIAEKGKKVRYFEDHHEIGIFDTDITLGIMEDAGFESYQIPNKNMDDNQIIYVGIKN